jgi:hypothetical protein
MISQRNTPTADDYKKRQEDLNMRFTYRVKEWLTYFDIDYTDKVIHILEGPPTSRLPWRSDKVSTRARFLWIGAKIRFVLGWTHGECPSFKPASKKNTVNKQQALKSIGLRKIILQVPLEGVKGKAE